MAEQTCDSTADTVKNANPYKLHTLFDVDVFKTLTKGIKLANCVRPKVYDDYLIEEINKEMLSKIQDLAVSDTLSCSYCCVNFEDKTQQRQHYKLDWHRYNLKQNLEGKKPVSEEKFGQLADDVSSISGSDNEEEELHFDSLLPAADENSPLKTEGSSNFLSGEHLRQPKVFFENEDGNIISLYRCVLHGKKDIPEKENQLISLALQCQSDPTWAIVMLGGGHFAAAIFEGDVAVAHKTFHCYTVRAGQGGTQGSRDSKNATSHPKSAGASLRRYNEASLVQHVQEIMQGWSEQLAKCSRIFWRAAGPHNQSVLFGGKTAPLVKSDLRLRSIPFPTRRPTFFEVQRVHKVLSSLEIYGCAENYVDKFPVSPRSNIGKREKKPYNSASSDAKKEDSESNETSSSVIPEPLSPKKYSGGRVIDRAKARRSPCRPLPEIVQELAKESPESSGNEGEDYKIVVPTLESFEKENLTEYEDTVPSEVKKQVAEKKRGNKGTKSAQQKKVVPVKTVTAKSEEVMLDESLLKLAKEIREACQSGDVDLLKLYIVSTQKGGGSTGDGNIVEGSGEAFQESNDSSSVLSKIQGHVFEDGLSVMHAASLAGYPDVVRLLLEAGFDPAVKNKKGQSPYAVSANKEVRNAFRRFMAEFPDKYDYTKAQVPGPLTEELEKELEAKAAEKRKLARKLKKEKEKMKKKEEEERKERERFLNLSEREKRALAAERRILERSMKGHGKPVVIHRCYQCAVDITGKVPFEYDTFKFCTMNCLKEHRAKTKPSS